MRLEDCVIGDQGVWESAPWQRSQPEPDWQAAADAGIIPRSLMTLYCHAAFLSYGNAPPFLADDRHQLFGYFSLMMRGLKGCLGDADQELKEFDKSEAKVRDIGKETKGEEWDPGASGRSKKQFRLVLISLCSSLDCLAELTALLLPNSIHGLDLGRAEFSAIEVWLKDKLPPLPVIASPQQVKLGRLHDVLATLVHCQGEERGWLPFTRLLRNKSAHLGTDQFREIGLHDTGFTFYTFLPTTWPFLWEEYVTSNVAGQAKKQGIEIVTDVLMHQDKIAYLHGLHSKINRLVGSAIEVLDSVYCDHQNFTVDPTLEKSLSRNTKKFSFRGFPADPAQAK